MDLTAFKMVNAWGLSLWGDKWKPSTKRVSLSRTSQKDHMDRIAHPFEICLAEQFGHGWG